MRIDILTLFPEMFRGPFSESIIGRAQQSGALDIRLHNIRDWAKNKHHKTDDYPFGGGAGLVMMVQPIADAITAVDPGHDALRLLLTPRGKVLSTQMARGLAGHERLLLLCGHYEGVDERVMSRMDGEVSIGDYILTGGELPAMVLLDCVARFVPGVLGSGESAEDESFSRQLLEYPQYTRPSDFRGERVPDVLLSGHAANIEKWRHEQAVKKTRENRPDLIGTHGRYFVNKGKIRLD